MRWCVALSAAAAGLAAAVLGQEDSATELDLGSFSLSYDRLSETAYRVELSRASSGSGYLALGISSARSMARGVSLYYVAACEDTCSGESPQGIVVYNAVGTSRGTLESGLGTITNASKSIVEGNLVLSFVASDIAGFAFNSATHIAVAAGPVTNGLPLRHSSRVVEAHDFTSADIQTTSEPTTLPTTNTPTTLPPTTSPTALPTDLPTTVPTTTSPTALPTSISPTALPTTTSPTTALPSAAPSAAPTRAPVPGTRSPTGSPTTLSPTTAAPTISPTTEAPTEAPTVAPSLPTLAPTTAAPTPPTAAPTAAPTTAAPSASPTMQPTPDNSLRLFGGLGQFTWQVVENPKLPPGGGERRRLQEEEEPPLQVRAALTVQKGPDGWLSLGLGGPGGIMAGSNVVIGLKNGAQEYTLGSQELSDVEVYPGQEITDASFSSDATSMTLSFTASSIAGRPISLAAEDAVVFAYGETDSLGAHDPGARVAAVVNWGDPAPREDRTAMFVSHGTLMILAYAVLFPSAAMMSVFRLCFASPSRWFFFHRWLALLAVVLALAGLFVIMATYEAGQDHFVGLHRAFGLAVVCASVAQPLLAMLRKGKARPAWFVQHMVFGSFIFGGGLANCYTGLRLAPGFIRASKVDVLAGFLHVATALFALFMLFFLINRYKSLQASKHRNSDGDIEEDTSLEAEEDEDEDDDLLLADKASPKIIIIEEKRGKPGPFYEYDPARENDDVEEVNLT